MMGPKVTKSDDFEHNCNSGDYDDVNNRGINNGDVDDGGSDGTVNIHGIK